jgi:hypothetical protein
MQAEADADIEVLSLELKTESFAMAYRTLLASAFVVGNLSKIAHARPIAG